MEKETFIVFGAPDPESAQAVRHVKNLIGDGRTDIGYGFAANNYGKPSTSSRQAYSSKGIVDEAGNLIKFLETKTLILFECGRSVSDVVIAENIVLCDHHLPGHPGFESRHDQYQEGSSLGQLLDFFNILPTERDLMIMACDHCLAFAYNELCPGIDPVACKAMRLGILSRYYATENNLKYKGNIATLGLIISQAQKTIKEADSITITRGPVKNYGNSQIVYDLRSVGLIDEVNEAACRLGIAYIDSEVKPYEPSVRTISLKGLCFPWMVDMFVQYFKDVSTKVIAVPNRGFAKVYVPITCNPAMEQIFSFTDHLIAA